MGTHDAAALTSSHWLQDLLGRLQNGCFEVARVLHRIPRRQILQTCAQTRLQGQQRLPVLRHALGDGHILVVTLGHPIAQTCGLHEARTHARNKVATMHYYYRHTHPHRL